MLSMALEMIPKYIWQLCALIPLNAVHYREVFAPWASGRWKKLSHRPTIGTSIPCVHFSSSFFSLSVYLRMYLRLKPRWEKARQSIG